jgi:hypothetical protein
MKKLFVICMAVIFTSGCFSQKLYETQLPEAVVKAFKLRFKDATNVKWEKEDTVYVAEFLMDESTTEVEYDTNGVWLNTEWTIPLEYTPQAIKNYIDSAFIGYKLKELNITDFSNEGKLYVAEVNKKKETAEVFFTLTGEFKRSEKEVADKKKKDKD